MPHFGYYDLFGLPPDCSSAQIKRAYYQRARDCHPDKHPNDEAKADHFKELSNAYQTLSDSERRAVYDAFGPEGLNGENVNADPKQVFAAMFGGPEFEPWVGDLAVGLGSGGGGGGEEDDKLQATVAAAQKRCEENHAKLMAMMRAGDGDADDIAATKQVQKTLDQVEDAARKAVKDAAAAAHRQKVQECAAFLEQKIAPFVAAQLAGDAVDAAAKALALRLFEESVEADAEKLRRCSMGDKMLHTLGYAYVRQTQKVRGKAATTRVERLGGLYEKVLQGAHMVSEGASDLGHAARMASAAWRLAKDARDETPPEKKLSDAQRAELEEQIKSRTMELAP